jgi:antitoxin component YwqK of YwqJK toxin-antitoxin module
MRHTILLKIQLFLIFLLIFGFNGLWAQNITDINPSYNIKQDGLSHRFTLSDYTLKEKKNHKKQKTYYWYKAQKIIATQGGSSGTLLNGVYTSYYTDDQLCEKGNFDQGLKDGEWKKWHSNGRLMEVCRWRNGRQIGRQLYYSDQGQIEKSVWLSRFRKEVKTVDSIQVIRMNREKLTLLDTLGKITEVQKYRRGKLHGRQVVYETDRAKTVSYFRKGNETEFFKAKRDKVAKEEKTKTVKEKKPKKEKKVKESKKPEE